MASVIFKIIATSLSKVGWVRFPHSPATSLAIALVCGIALVPVASQAQQRDSGRVGIAVPTTQAQPAPRSDSAPRPPMTPRRAFLTSLLLPGYAQTVFGRDRAAMLFTVIEIGSLAMARKSALDLAEARALAHDSVVATYKIDPNTGLAITDSKGLPVPETWIASRYTPDRIKARRTHYEDWIAAIIFNHLFSGADAYVAANLWDFNANIGAVSSTRSVTVYASIRLR
ncbi:MAG: hypothetical protein JWL97_2382 [Gemmatimonadales bacterium]|nr:hypothetical protein [Gemmatimonadales bacterium]